MNAAKAYADAVKRQGKAQKTLDDLNDAWAVATEPSARLRCRLATEAAERELQARIAEVEVAHSAYWAGRAAELVPALEELGKLALRFDVMMRAAGNSTVEPWLMTVRGVLTKPLAPDVLGSLVSEVPLRPETSDEFDCHEGVMVDRERAAKLNRDHAKGRKWL